jgi:hypothetical protein
MCTCMFVGSIQDARLSDHSQRVRVRVRVRLSDHSQRVRVRVRVRLSDHSQRVFIVQLCLTVFR